VDPRVLAITVLSSTHARVDLLGVTRTKVFHALPLSPVGSPADIEFDSVEPTA
jgi:hypothetical protein